MAAKAAPMAAPVVGEAAPKAAPQKPAAAVPLNHAPPQTGPKAAPKASAAPETAHRRSEINPKAAVKTTSAPDTSMSGAVAVPKAAPKSSEGPNGTAPVGGAAEPPPVAPKEPSKLIAKGVGGAAFDPEAMPTALERVSAFGSTLFRGAQAAVDPPKAKPEAKASAGGSGAPGALPKAAMSAMPRPVATPAKASGSGSYAKGPGAAAGSVAASAAVVETVSMKPAPARAGTNGYAAQPASTTTARNGAYQGQGAARAYAATAAPLLEKHDPKGDIPREGPATVAVGRAMATGQPAIVQNGGLPQAPIKKKYQIVLVSSELAPYSKTGGLGEALDGLSVALAALGHRVMVITPRYDQYEDAWDTSFWSSVDMGGKTEPVHFFHAFKQKVDQVFVDHPAFSECVNGKTGSKLYGPQFGEDFVDNQARFAYFCKAALVAIRSLPLGGVPYGEEVVVVANDWHSGLVPVFIEAERRNGGNWRRDRTKCVSLTHNAAYQGRFKLEPGLAEVFGLPQDFIDKITLKMPIDPASSLEKVDCVNHLAANLIFSDLSLSVSPTYALEISTNPDKGVELEKLFLAGRATGILNGIKEGVSASDATFLANASITCGPFTVDTVDAAKAEMKRVYLSNSTLPASEGPMVCFIGRLDVQKGYDLLMAALEEVLLDTEMQVIIIGAGRVDLTTQTKALAAQFPSKVCYEGWMGPERYAVLGACDYTLFPSRWEPCGLVQMECMRLGTVPVVAPTGGLKDTVEDDITGFWTDTLMTNETTMCEESVASIARVLRRMANSYTSAPKKVTEMRQAAMAASAEFTWSNAALQYEAVFEELGAVDVLPQCADGMVTLQADALVS